MQHPTVIRIEFPALDNLVCYLRERDQENIDAIAASFMDLAGRMAVATGALKTAVNTSQGDTHAR